MAAPKRGFAGFRGNDDIALQLRAEKSHTQQKRLEFDWTANDTLLRQPDYTDAGLGAFSRMDIVPGQNRYAANDSRNRCRGPDCSSHAGNVHRICRSRRLGSAPA